MEYQKIINLLNWFEIKWWIERKVCNIRFKTSMTRSNLYDYSDGYILVKGTITVPNMAGAGVAVNKTNKKVIKLCSISWLHNRNKQYTSRWCSKNWLVMPKYK